MSTEADPLTTALEALDALGRALADLPQSPPPADDESQADAFDAASIADTVRDF